MSDTNEGVVVAPEANEGETAETPTVEELQQKLKDMEATVGSTKRELKDAKKALEDAKNALSPQTPEQTQQSSEPDYAKLAFLEAKKVNHPDDQKLVLDEAKRLNLPITDILQMEHIKSKMEASQAQRESQDAMPNGSGRKSGASKGDVDYYLAHPDEVPQDLELHNKVIEAKMRRIENESMFSDTMFVER